ncbi:MAG TPA: CAP domain-containing protein [Rhodopseudomonas sp.]|uniref:CAP domain-containing protein n=1 Tax=Rhodopseudomonas sp. TaxID=1078 RepID=UPI002ED7B63C
MKSAWSIGAALWLAWSAGAAAQPADVTPPAAIPDAAVAAQPAPAAPAEMISSFRLAHGLGRVTLDAKLTQIAHEQAAAMAAKDVLSHEVLGPFTSRVAPAHAGQAAENVAYGNDGFPKTLTQWINSPGHLRNLLMPGASRVGVASARSSATRRTYWAMVIAGGYDKPEPRAKKPAPKTAPKTSDKKSDKPSGKSSGKTSLNPTPSTPSQQSSREACRVKLLGLCL